MKATLDGGQTAELLALQGEVLRMRSPRAFAPGKPLRITAHLDDGRDLALAGKVSGSKRREDGCFEVRLRLVNLRRTERELVRSAL